MANITKKIKNKIVDYFKLPGKFTHAHKRFMALYYFFSLEWSAEKIAAQLGFTKASVYSMIRDFQKIFTQADEMGEDPFFNDKKIGRKGIDNEDEVSKLIIQYRKTFLSVPEIKTKLDAYNFKISERSITNILSKNGFPRIPRRDRAERLEGLEEAHFTKSLKAPVSMKLQFDEQKEAFKFSTQMAGVLLFLPLIKHYGIDKLIRNSLYPRSTRMNNISSILCFLALKLTNVERYSYDNIWCMDRGLGLFAGLTVLPKGAWFSSYSNSVSR
jgi:predicted DNA-binding protein YlxM (UPF0122 family)